MQNTAQLPYFTPILTWSQTLWLFCIISGRKNIKNCFVLSMNIWIQVCRKECLNNIWWTQITDWLMLEIKSVQDAAGKFYSCPSVTDAADIQQRWFVTPLVIILCPISSPHNESHAPQLPTLGLEPRSRWLSVSLIWSFLTGKKTPVHLVRMWTG